MNKMLVELNSSVLLGLIGDVPLGYLIGKLKTKNRASTKIYIKNIIYGMLPKSSSPEVQRKKLDELVSIGFEKDQVHSMFRLIKEDTMYKLVEEMDEKILKRNYDATREAVANIQFLSMKEHIEVMLREHNVMENQHLQTVVVVCAKGLKGEKPLTQWIFENGPVWGLKWDTSSLDEIEKLVKEVMKRGETQRFGLDESFYDWYSARNKTRSKDAIRRDYAYAVHQLSQPFKISEWTVERRHLSDKYKDQVAYCSFEDRTIVYNDMHLKENIYDNIFHIQTACHEVAHALLFGSEHGPAWANLARALGDESARASDRDDESTKNYRLLKLISSPQKTQLLKY